jgi:tol-pal system protein YbgF
MRKSAIVAVLIGLASIPAQAQNREHLQMAAELRILQQQNQELANALAQAIQLLSETAKSLNSRIDQTNDTMRKGFADQSITLGTAAGDSRKTLAQTQDLATRLGELKEEVNALRTSLPALISRLAPTDAGPPSDPDVAAAAAAAVAASQAPPTGGITPQRMYDTAYEDYALGRYAQAVSGFEEFLKTFPTSTRAPSAQQYLGEAEFYQNRVEQAIAAYSLVIQNYPKSDQVPWAYYKRGMAQSRLQQSAAARTSFEAVVKQFPETEPAILALSQLQRLDSAPPPATTTRKP